MNSAYTCPVCQCPGTFCLGQYPEFDNASNTFSLFQCQDCRTVFTTPIKTNLEMAPYYDHQYYGSERQKFIAPIEWLIKALNFLLAKFIFHKGKLIAGTSTILDIGCGRGQLLHHLCNLGVNCHGVEREDTFSSETKNGITLHARNLRDIRFPEAYFDTIILWHVLEHVCDPMILLQEIRRILKPGGKLWIAVPNMDSFQSHFFKKHWFHLDIPRHRFHFSLFSLTRLLSSCGFNILNQHTFSLEQNIYGFFQSFMNWISFNEKPHLFYECLKFNSGLRSPLVMLKGTLTMIFISIFAVLEFVISGFTGKGAVLVCEVEISSI